MLDLFVGALTQMRYTVAAIGETVISAPVGLDYPGVRAHAEGLGIPITPEIWRGFQLCESTYLKALAENRR